MSEAAFGTWTVPESPLTIQYSLVVIEEIRREVAQGFQKMARGGIEVGGVLYGRREGRVISILAMRPIACEHALGPSFQLSPKDREGLKAQLIQEQADPHLQGMICAGLIVSHTRSEIALSEPDLDLYNTFFEAPWQVMMVVRPGRAGAMRAGFFVREPDGSIRSDSCYQEFNFPDRPSGVLERARPDRPPADRLERRGTVGAMALAAAPVPVPAFGQAAPAELPAMPPERASEPHITLFDSSIPAPPRKARWPWLLAWALALATLGFFGWRYFELRPTIEPISLSVLEREGQLQVSWSHTARSILGATRGTLEISDGGDTKRLSLTPDDLQRGSLTYQRRTGDVEVRMIVEDQGGEKTQEASRYLGRPPEKHDDAQVKELDTQRSNLEDENNKLRGENAAQAQRIQQLERIVKIMQTRQGEAPQQ